MLAWSIDGPQGTIGQNSEALTECCGFAKWVVSQTREQTIMVGTRAEAIPATEDSGQLELMSLPTWLDVHDWDVTVETSLPRQATSLIRLKW